MTLAQLKAKIDSGYEVFAVMCGRSMGGVLGHIAPLYNVQTYPSSGEATKILGDFCILDGGHAKAVCVEFTDGEAGDGVYVRGLQALHLKGGDVATEFMDIAPDGTISYKNYTNNLDELATAWDNGNYGVGNVQMAKFVPHDSTMLVWPGTVLDDVKDYEITGFFGGKASRFGYTCTAYNKRIAYDDENSATNMVVEMQTIDGVYTKCVVVNFMNGEDGVHAQGLTALHVSGDEIGQSFSNSDGTYADTGDSVATGYGELSYGIYGLTAQKKAVYSQLSGNITSTAALAFPDITLDDIKDDYLGCRFASHAVNKPGIEGRGCNRRITYGENGSAVKIRVEFQTRDGGSAGYMYVKCVVVDFTDGPDGVYASRVGASYMAEKNPVGVEFVSKDGSYSGSSSYNVYGLFAAPCITLSADEDWTPYGRQYLGDAVVDLNGHSLTTGELVFDTSRTGMVVNTAHSTTAQMHVFSFAGGTVSNDTVNVGNYCIGTDNIKLVAEGHGTYYAARSMEYTGGTQIASGVVAKPAKQPMNALNFYAFGASGKPVIIDSGAALDWNNTWNHFYYEYVLNGGELGHTGSIDFNNKYALLNRIRLTADSSFTNKRRWGLINNSYNEVMLDLGGHTLDIAISPARQIYFSNVKATAGNINVHGEHVLEVMDKGVGLSAPETDFNVACELRLFGDMSVHDYTAADVKEGTNLGTGALNVHGTFKPATAYFRGVTMQNGSTIDLSQWPESAEWPISSAYTCDGDKEIRFANAEEGKNTTVTVKLGDRRKSDGKLFSWADGADVSHVKFVRGDSDRHYSLVKKDDGLYTFTGFFVTIR